MRCGIMLSPFHPPHVSPHVSMQLDIELVQRLDQLGYDEVWIGEHHSAGWEAINSPELFMALLAERTRHIRLGAGVVSLPYHHPYMVAARIVQLDRQTRGRVMLGMGPGSLTSDAQMLGIDPSLSRNRSIEAADVVVRLINGETVTATTDWFSVRDAMLQLSPRQTPFPLVSASSASPAGAVMAGTFGTGMLSLNPFLPEARENLGKQWHTAETVAKEHGKTVDRDQWRIVIPVHVGHSREQVLEEVEAGGDRWLNGYYGQTVGVPPIFVDPKTGASSYRRMAESGGALFGTPDDVIAGLNTLVGQTGGFGTIVALENCVGSQQQRLRSYELFAQYVMPVFQRSTSRLMESQRRSAARAEEMYRLRAGAQEKARLEYEAQKRSGG